MKNKEISKKIYNQRVINKINNKIKLLGISSKLTTEKFLIIRLITTIIIFLFILIKSLIVQPKSLLYDSQTFGII